MGGTPWAAHRERHTWEGVHEGRYTRAIVVTAKGKQPPHSDAEEGAKDEPHKCLTKTYAKTSAEGDGLAPTSPMK